jgi:hypothetical protein
VCLLAILMTGCIKLNMDLQLQSDDTVDGSVIFAVNKQVLQLTGKSFDDLTGGQSAVPSGVPVQTSDYDDDQYSGKKYTFEDVPISRFSGDGSTDSLSIVHQGDTFVVSGALDLSAADTSQIPNADQAFSTADISLSITFPGAVQAASAGGVISGNTVTWKPTFGAKTEITATGSAISTGRGPLPWILFGAGVLIVVIVVLVLLARRKPKESVQGEMAMAMEGAPPSGEGESAAVPPPPPAPAATTPVTDVLVTEAPVSEATVPEVPDATAPETTVPDAIAPETPDEPEPPAT